MFENINYVEILASGVAAMVVGFLWYGPVLGKLWQKESGVTAAKIEAGKKEMPKTYGLMFIAALVQAYVLAMLISLAGATDMMSAATVAFWAWLGFVATVRLSDVLFEGKSTTLFGINVGYTLVTLIVMSAIIVTL